MAKARILAGSIADAPTLTATSAAIAVGNLQNSDVNKVWRSSGLAAQTISWDYGEQKDHNAIGLFNTNGTSATEYIIELSNDNFATLVYSENFTVFGSNTAYTSAVHWFGTGGYQVADSGGVLVADAGGTTLQSATWTLPVSARYGRLVINDAANADGYMEIGRLMIGKYFDAPSSENITVGPSLRYLPRAALTVMRGGAMRAAQLRRPAQISVMYQFAHQDDSYAIGTDSFAEILEEIGHETDVLYSAFPTDGDDRERRYTVLGRIMNNPALDTHFIQGGDLKAYQRVPLTIREQL